MADPEDDSFLNPPDTGSPPLGSPTEPPDTEGSGAEPEAKATPVEVPQEDAPELSPSEHAEIKTLRAQLETERKRVQGLDRALTKTSQQAAEITALRGSLQALEDLILQLGDRLPAQEGEENEQGTRPSLRDEVKRQRESSARSQAARLEAEAEAEWRAIGRDYTRRGLPQSAFAALAADPNFLAFWTVGNFDGASDYAAGKSPQGIPSTAVPGASTEEEITSRTKAEVNRILKEKGVLKAETGTSSGAGLSGLSRAELQRRIEAPGGLDWFRKNEEAIDRLHREGRLK